MLVAYLTAMAQNVTRSNVKVNGSVLSHSLSVHKSMMAGKARQLTVPWWPQCVAETPLI